MRKFTQQDINEMHYLYRINLINSCSGYKSANFIRTKSKNECETAFVKDLILKQMAHF